MRLQKAKFNLFPVLTFRHRRLSTLGLCKLAIACPLRVKPCETPFPCMYPFLYHMGDDCYMPASPPASVCLSLLSDLACFSIAASSGMCVLPSLLASLILASSSLCFCAPSPFYVGSLSSSVYLALFPPVQIQEHYQWELLSFSLFCPF